MVSKELKKLSRKELVDIIYQLKKNEQELTEQNLALKAELENKRINLSVAGSIAEATVGITGVFTTAQNTADLYLNEIAAMKAETEKQCKAKLENATKTSNRILAEAEQQFANLKASHQAELERWQTLQREIKELEKIKLNLERKVN